MFSFNGVSATDMGLGVTAVRRSILPEIVSSSQSVPGMAGAFLMSSNIGARYIEIDVYYLGTDMADAMDITHDVAAWLFSQSPLELAFDDEAATPGPTRVYYAMLDGSTDLEAVAEYRAGTLTFVCHDPYAYSDTPDEFTLVVINDQTGVCPVCDSGALVWLSVGEMSNG